METHLAPFLASSEIALPRRAIGHSSQLDQTGPNWANLDFIFNTPPKMSETCRSEL